MNGIAETKNGSGFRIGAQLIFGLIILALGVLFLLDNLGFVRAAVVLRYWPAALVLIGLVKVFQRGAVVQRVFGGVLILVGSVMLIGRLSGVSIRLWDFWPVVLLFLGGYLIWQAVVGKPAAVAADPASKVRLAAIMSGVEHKNVSQSFRGGEATAFMGGVEMDLRQASIADGEAVLDVLAWWGGVGITVPEDWQVTTKILPLMGGAEDKRKVLAVNTSKHLIVRGLVVMGGIEIKN